EQPGARYLASRPVTVRHAATPARPKPTTAPVRAGKATPVAHEAKTPPVQLPKGKVLFFTFDDGPQRTWTPIVLRMLARHHAKATFFQLGVQVAELPDLARQVRAEGHTIGNHTYDHKPLTTLTPQRVRWELEHGPRNTTCFRPPSRDTNPQVAAIAASYGLRQILWDVDTKDWERPGAPAIESAIMRGVRPGAIILVHDGGGDRSETVAAVDRAMTRLAADGYRFAALPC
ncbi:MAG TPA: polysaccharide deacetylase family protein, partial [Kribbellaceae bacterium]